MKMYSMADSKSFSDVFKTLSAGAKSIWAKASGGGGTSWLPLVIHMYDSAEIAKLLWREWVPHSTKKLIAGSFSELKEEDALERGEALLIFLAAAHDLGKAIPAFQYGRSLRYTNESLARELACAVEKEGLRIRSDIQSPGAIHHSLASGEILKRNGFERGPSGISIVLGGHHGKPPSSEEIQHFDSYPNHTGFRDKAWCDVQDELLNFAAHLSDLSLDTLRPVKLPITVQVILTGLVIMTDWIASDESRFPYIEEPYCTERDFLHRADCAWEDLKLPGKWEAKDYWKSFDLFKERFDFHARPVQKAVNEAAKGMETPGIMIIEAPMGEGKTEAALVATEIFAEKFGMGGLFFALPTQATADGIFPRMKDWISEVASENDENRSIFLAHGKSAFNKNYNSIKRNLNGLDGTDDRLKDSVIVHEWFSGRKKGLLSDFVIGTVDQILMGGLKQKHLALRHLALANKVIIIDEVHAYDAYMGSYLLKVLQWLGAYGVPVILLSATLQQSRREEIINAYLFAKSKGIEPQDGSRPWVSNCSYPLITYTSDLEVKQVTSDRSDRILTVKTDKITDEGLPDLLEKITDGGGYVGIIVNTVKKAQRIAEKLTEMYGEECVHLLHSRFVSIERTQKEERVRDMLSEKNRVPPPYRAFVVGTQVMEQSLDLDFDLIVTDLCPIDLLLQRIGRLHRHKNNVRPEKLKEAQCFVLDEDTGDFDEGSKAIYKKYHLMVARRLLSEPISLPDSIPKLIQSAYGEDKASELLKEYGDEYVSAKKEMTELIERKCDRAQAFQIKEPKMSMEGLRGWLDREKEDDAAGRIGEATVRDTDGLLEVIVIQQRGNRFYVLPIEDNCGGKEIPITDILNQEMCFALAGCKIALPRSFSALGQLDRTIKELERNNIDRCPGCWQESGWLAGELFLILDENNTAMLRNKKLTYSNKLGLCEEDT